MALARKRSMRSLLATAPAAMLLALSSSAWALQAISGDPIASTSVGLDHDPEALAAGGTTNAQGRATLSVRLNAASNRLSAYVIERSRLRAPVTMGIDAGRQSVVSAPILPGRGRGYAVDARGRRLYVTLTGRRGERREVAITVTAARGAATP